MAVRLQPAEILVVGPDMGRATRDRGGVKLKLRPRKESRITIATRIPPQVPVSALHFSNRNGDGVTIDITRVRRLAMFSFTGRKVDEAIRRAVQASDFRYIERILDLFLETILEIDLTA